LIVFIDDATSKITAAVFVPVESANGYYLALQQHLQKYGLPISLYSDCHGIFKINAKDAVSGDGKTAFTKSLDELKIGIIHASTPQAKGRVERANQTLQDRLIKEMRLKNISNIDDANAFLPEFIAKHNAKFAIAALENKDAHRPLSLDGQQLQRILCNKETRVLSKQLSFSYNGNFYLIKTKIGQVGYAMRNQKITVCSPPNQPIMAFYKDKKLELTLLDKKSYQPIIADDKSINWHVNNLANNLLKSVA
jgi:hypothetical protein